MNDAFPANVVKYGETPIFTEETVPEKLTGLHNTKSGVWGRIVVLDGALDYVALGPPERQRRLVPGVIGVIRPTEPHRVAPAGPVRFKVEFLKDNAAP